MTPPRFLLVGLVFLAPAPPLSAQGSDVLAEQARDVLRRRCAECHDFGPNVRARLHVLDFDDLVAPERPLVIPNQPDASELLQLVECGTMPQGARPKVPAAERKLLRDWIAAGAPRFLSEAGDQYALTRILDDVRAADGDANRNLANERYLTLNHLLAEGRSAADLDLHRAALNKALNQLSLKPDLTTLKPIDPAGTIFRIRLDDYGWDYRPFAADPQNPSKDLLDPTHVNLFDLVLLEYPFATLPERSPVGKAVVREYLAKSKTLLPIPYVRGDWFVGAATQPPLYEDLLRLPVTLPELEQRLGVYQNGRPARAGITQSNVTAGNRIVERRPAETVYWRTYDLPGPAGPEGLKKDAAAVKAGGAMIFGLPNGLPGYFLADAGGRRLAEITPARLNAELAKSGPVRNGLACMRCHERGLAEVRGMIPQPPLYPAEADFDKLLAADNKRFAETLSRVLMGLTQREPLTPVTGTSPPGRTDAHAREKVTPVSLDARRPAPAIAAFEAVRAALDEPKGRKTRGIAPPDSVPPLDALTRPDWVPKGTAITFEFKAAHFDPEKPVEKDGPVFKFRPDDKMVIVLKNTSPAKLYFELVLTRMEGGSQIFRNKITLRELAPGEEFFLPSPCAKEKFILINDEIGKDQWTAYVSDAKFPPGVRLAMNEETRPRCEFVRDRIVHPLYKLSADGGQIESVFDPAKLVKKTIVVETVAR